MRIGSLFSGIGGLELGLEWSGIGHTVWQVETDPGCKVVLASRWPHAERFDDVCTVGSHNLPPVDLLCGGFPCQDVSSAGKRAGLTGARSGLWFEYLRIVRELRPTWVVVENVASGARAWVDTVLTGLGELGYACLPIPLSAADVGAPHLRRRIFIVAYSEREAIRLESWGERGEGRTRTRVVMDDREEALAYTNEARREGASAGADEGRTQPPARSWGSPVPDILRVVHGLPDRLDARNACARPRIAALGNAVVPQCAEVIGHVIRELNT